MLLRKTIFLCLYLAIFNYLFQAINAAEKIPLNSEEISNIGTGVQVISNIKNNDSYAIIRPPLSGTLSAILIEKTFKNDGLISDDKYYDFISYLQTMNAPHIIGAAILENFNGNKLRLRSVQIMSILIISLIIYIYCKISTNSTSIGIFSVILFLLFLQFYDLYGEIIRIDGLLVTQIFLWSGLITMISILKKLTVSKSIILGVLFAGAIMAGGGNAILLMLILLMSCLISRDIANKKISNGFNEKWIYCILLSIGTFLLIVWIGYSAKMNAPEDLIIQQFYSFFQKYNVEKHHIIPFMDIIKKFIFDILFSQPNDGKNTISIMERYTFFIEKLLFIPTILLSIFFFKRKELKQHIITLFITAILLLLSLGIYRDPSSEEVKSYMQMVMLFMVGINSIFIVYLVKEIHQEKL